MVFAFNDITYFRIIDHYGSDHQKRKAAEELCELTAEILKDVAGHGNIEHITEEMADAIIMINQLLLIYGNRKSVIIAQGEKIRRTLKRMENDDTGPA